MIEIGREGEGREMEKERWGGGDSDRVGRKIERERGRVIWGGGGDKGMLETRDREEGIYI